MKEMKDWYLKNFRVIRLIKLAALLACISVSLCGCAKIKAAADKVSDKITEKITSLFEDDEPEIEEAKSDDAESTQSDLITFENEIKVIHEAEEEDNSVALPKQNLASAAFGAFDNDSFSYAYNKLSPGEQTAYMEIYTILDGVMEDVILTGKDTDEIDKAFRAVMLDHPEIFYVDGYTIGKYMTNGELDKISFCGSYSMTKEEIEEKRRRVDEYVERILINAPGSDDYEKIKYVYEYMVNNNTYDLSAENNQNVLSVVEGGRTVCQGYAKMMQLVLGRLDIFCTLVNGSAASSDSEEYNAHVWNIVKCNGEYYNLDATWGDSVFKLIDSNGGASPRIDVNYEFFLVPDSFLNETHRPDPVVEMPACTCLNDNYYVREGLYFTEIDEEQLRNAFEKEYSAGASILFIKAMDSTVYDELMNYLFTDHNVFQFTGTDNVRYVNVDSRNLIMISL